MSTIQSWSRVMLALIVMSCGAFGQTAADLGEGLRAELTGTAGVTAIKWWGKAGRTYFLQSSATLDHSEWIFTPVLESGADALLSWNLQTSAERMFVRLVYTDMPTGGNAATADFDGDGTSNSAELTAGSSPFLRDSDWDGYTDSEEIGAGSDPSSGGSDPGTDPEPTGPLDPDDRYKNGLRLDYAYKFLDSTYRKTQNAPNTSPIIISDGIVQHGYIPRVTIFDPPSSSTTNLEPDLLSAYLDTPFIAPTKSLFQHDSYGTYVSSLKSNVYFEGLQGSYGIRDTQMRYRYEIQAVPSSGAPSGAQRAMLLVLYRDGLAESNIKEVGSVTFSQHNVTCTDSVARHCEIKGNKVVIETNLDEEVDDRDASTSGTWKLQDYQLLMQPINLDIYNGQGAQTFAPRKYDVGAFTVANLNDTDADGTIDNVDNNVPGEKDLMKLYIGGYTGKSGNIKIRVKSGSVKFWEQETKVTEIPLQNKAVTFPIPSGGTGITKTIWVEATAASTKVRDIELEEVWEDGTGKEHPATDKVRATAVWAEMTGTRNSTTDPLWQDADGADIKNLYNNFIGTFGINFAPPDGRIHYSIGFEFTVKPSEITKEPNIKFDITRQSERRYFTLSANTWLPFLANEWENLPSGDVSNDDTTDVDEDTIPKKDHIYSIDGPGPANSGASNQFVGKANFNEFVRVSFDGSRPSGENTSGSRCSVKSPWHSFFWITGNGSSYSPTQGQTNSVGPNHLPIGSFTAP